ncbi:hypothetical protein V1520DRAFT_229010 [Lipomyces starkeyi]|uniref:Uncharacterized protein n=1 Tax=Lipomyces starkeyi NRRL Y-11557 TaxID=675824 RepID=A0A1E3Q3P2_LIPST|nr:hypothetical protein LIPSTDRAFT_292364 [Lipomyces starkeyi NRRL Y-11557]
MALATFRMILIFSALCILGLRVSAAALHRCPDRSIAATPSTSVLNFDHITTVTSIASLPTNFHYPDYLYLSEFQLLNCSSFSRNSSNAKACSSGNIALLSTGSGSMVFGTPDSDTFSNYRYMNLSSMRVTNLEQADVSVLLHLYLHTPMAGFHMVIQPINSRFLKEVPCC